ncbi:MAG: transporter substrate-binding domain-containing protein [Alphaproteobacteria bacterium]|nr:transporter substrate-binding domain-containing protein [Alphaproteobacteria bacterium]
MSLKRKVLGVIAATAIAFATVGTAGQAMAASVVDDILKRGKIIVGLSTFVPWAMRDRNGDVIGFEVDVINKLAKDMGVKVELVPTAFDGIIPALLAKKFDVIITGMVVKPKRNLTVNFSKPYAYLTVGMAANKKMAEKAGLKTMEDWNSRSVTLTIKRGTAPGETAKNNFPKARVRQFDDDAQALQDVLNGNAHAFLTSEPKPTHYVLDNPGVLYHPFGRGPFDPSASAFAVRKGDPDALNFFNNWIQYHELNGWLKATHDKWFKGRDWKSRLK